MARLHRHELLACLPPHRLVPWARGASACALDARGEASPTWGASPDGRAGPRSLLIADPELTFAGGYEALKDALRWLALQSDEQAGRAGLVGYLAYELGEAFEPLQGAPATPSANDLLPRVWLAAFRAAYHYDPLRHDGCVVGSDPLAVRRLAEQVLDWSARARRSPAVDLGALPAIPPHGRAATPGVAGEAGYTTGVEAILSWIRAGDVYQVNLSRQIELEALPDLSGASLYDLLCRRSPAPFGAFLDAASGQIVSNSPERFLHVCDREVQTCPIKGTRARGATPEEDTLLAKQLCASEKDRAEHLMIVDLERNDLGRVCEIGSVRVEELAQLRSFATVHHLVSSVRGRLRSGCDVESLLAATFPGGSITGAPKLRAREIIRRLEPVPRGVYTGAIGHLDASGGVDLSIAIRTAVVQGRHVRLHVGGGIVADSDPDQELQETHDKARAFAELWGSRP